MYTINRFYFSIIRWSQRYLSYQCQTVFEMSSYLVSVSKTSKPSMVFISHARFAFL